MQPRNLKTYLKEKMINYFRKRKEERERERLKQFKKNIIGIFRDWNIDHCTATKDGYSLWIGNELQCFKDYNCQKEFLIFFSKKEKELLWREFKNVDMNMNSNMRSSIFKEFNLNLK